VERFNDVQRNHIINHHLGHLLNVPRHLFVPLSLLQWLVRRMSNGSFVHKTRRIDFNKNMVDKVFGFPNGNVPFLLGSDDPDVVQEVKNIRVFYLKKGKKIPISQVEAIMLATNNEIVFMRSFIMFYIATILCPSTSNFVSSKYLYSLKDGDIEHVEDFDFATLCLNNLTDEIDAWSRKIFLYSIDLNKSAWIGGCLPLMDVCVFPNFFMF
jgi:hypothetical protein